MTLCQPINLVRIFFMTGKRTATQHEEHEDANPQATKKLRLSMSASSASSTSPLQLRENIRLTPQEQQLFEFLLDVEKQYECKAVLRVAGGWVRDKLLGRHSDDVDIVLDSMKGKEFADLINTYERDHGHKQHPVGVIKANPDQSKHLETATMQLGEIGWVDFVNLRAETYSEDHRIPDVVRIVSLLASVDSLLVWTCMTCLSVCLVAWIGVWYAAAGCRAPRLHDQQSLLQHRGAQSRGFHRASMAANPGGDSPDMNAHA